MNKIYVNRYFFDYYFFMNASKLTYLGTYQLYVKDFLHNTNNALGVRLYTKDEKYLIDLPVNLTTYNKLKRDALYGERSLIANADGKIRLAKAKMQDEACYEVSRRAKWIALVMLPSLILFIVLQLLLFVLVFLVNG